LDAPLGDGWLLGQLGGRFAGVWFSRDARVPEEVAAGHAKRAQGEAGIELLHIADETACARYGAANAPAYYLFRPDGHVAARWRQFAQADAATALARATAAIP
jgi:3-(3-hydroxy-phenyl)propionate hydroxylase